MTLRTPTRLLHFLTLPLLAALSVGSIASAQQTRPAADAAKKVTPKVFLSVDKLPAGGTCEVAVRLDIAEGWHLNANPPSEDFLIPVKLEIRSAKGTKLKQTLYPAGEPYDFAGDTIGVYEGRTWLFGTLDVPEKAAGQTESLVFEVSYQACSHQNCLPEATGKISGRIPVAQFGETPKPMNEAMFRERPRVAATGHVIK